MTCMRKPKMLPREAPYRVEFRRRVSWEEAQTQMLWLVATDHATQGFFNNGRDDRNVVTPDKTIHRESLTWYEFTDENTAFLFKLQFG